MWWLMFTCFAMFVTVGQWFSCTIQQTFTIFSSVLLVDSLPDLSSSLSPPLMHSLNWNRYASNKSVKQNLLSNEQYKKWWNKMIMNVERGIKIARDKFPVDHWYVGRLRRRWIDKLTNLRYLTKEEEGSMHFLRVLLFVTIC